MNIDENLIEELDRLLPQTQCGQCHFSGCRPYAQAIIKHDESIDRCLPGGVDVLKAIGALLQKETEPYLEKMAQKSKPAVVAFIREEECIGCTKCIQACPVDAIIGANKLMHTVLTDVCTGCELCVKPCPVDCIELQPASVRPEEFKEQSRQRYLKHQARLEQENQQQSLNSDFLFTDSCLDKEMFIQAAVDRVRRKKQHHDNRTEL